MENLALTYSQILYCVYETHSFWRNFLNYVAFCNRHNMYLSAAEKIFLISYLPCIFMKNILSQDGKLGLNLFSDTVLCLWNRTHFDKTFLIMKHFPVCKKIFLISYFPCIFMKNFLSQDGKLGLNLFSESI